jgi:tight adherence protein B
MSAMPSLRSLVARRPRVVPLVVGSVLVTLAFAGVAAADAPVGVPQLQVEAVDATGSTITIDAIKTGPAEPRALETSVDGNAVRSTVTSFADAGLGTDAMVVADTSKGMGNGPVQLTKEAIGKIAPGTGDVRNVGVVTTGGGARLASALTGSPTTVRSSTRQVAPTGSSALWDGVVMAAKTLAADPTSNNHHIVIVAGTADAGSVHRFPEVEEALRTSHSMLHVVALPGGSPDVTSLQQLVAETGGTYQEGTSNDLAAMFAVVGDQLSHQFRISMPSPGFGDEPLASLRIDWSGAESEVGFRPGAVSIGARALTPVVDSSSLLDRLATSDVTKWLIVLLGMASAGMIVYSAAMLVSRRSEGLSFALRHYEGYHPGESDEVFDDELMPSITGNNALLKRAVAVTGELAERQGALSKIEDLLERADLPLRPAEALFFYVAAVVVAAIAAAVLSGDFLVFVMVVLVAMLAPNFIVKFRASRRGKKFVAQLPDMLQLLSGTLRAGYSIAQGLEAVSGEIDDPMGRELRRAMAEARLGRPIEDALDAVAERTQSEDFAWAVMAIRIQREVGGNLAELLMTVSDTMTQRERLRRDVAALTAEGRMSAYVLGCLPPGLAGVMWVMNPEYIGRLTHDSLGMILLGVAGVSMLIGFAWMRKIITIEI